MNDEHLPERRFRPELHGIRGLAILGVVLFHIFGAGRVSGGIDIFLAVSGFLFTATLLWEAAEHRGRIQLGVRLYRIAKRLIPLALLVIAVTVVLGMWLLPSTRHSQMFSEARASALYHENVELIQSQLSYEAAGPETSPFQHFWSLSVQGQFFLVWPLVALLAVFLSRRMGWGLRNSMLLLTAVVAVASFGWAMHMRTVNQAEAYFMTTTRFWELAFGALLALMISQIRVPQRFRVPVGWAGLLLVVTCGFFVDGAALFPGPWALWPLLGLALILVATHPQGPGYDRRFSAARILSTTPLARIGDLAYGLYLWHWPVLIFWLEATQTEQASLAPGLGVLGMSFVLAWVSHRWIELPINRSFPHVSWRPVLAGAAGLVLVLGSVIAVQSATEPPDAEEISAEDLEDHPGALGANVSQDEYEDFIPDPQVLAEDAPEYVGWGCRQRGGDGEGTGEVLVCEDPNAPEEPTATVMLAGGSHAGQYQETLVPVAQEYGWELLIAEKAGCRFGTVENPEEDKCAQWNLEFPETVEERGVDLVITPGSSVGRTDENPERVLDTAQERWQEIADAGAEVLLLRGISRPVDDVPDCLASGREPAECGARFDLYAENNPLEELDLPQGAAQIDLTPYICPEESCSAVVGGVAVYRDRSHLSTFYAETLAQIFEEKAAEEKPHLFDG